MLAPLMEEKQNGKEKSKEKSQEEDNQKKEEVTVFC